MAVKCRKWCCSINTKHWYFINDSWLWGVDDSTCQGSSSRCLSPLFTSWWVRMQAKRSWSYTTLLVQYKLGTWRHFTSLLETLTTRNWRTPCPVYSNTLLSQRFPRLLCVQSPPPHTLWTFQVDSDLRGRSWPGGLHLLHPWLYLQIYWWCHHHQNSNLQPESPFSRSTLAKLQTWQRHHPGTGTEGLCPPAINGADWSSTPHWRCHLSPPV